MTTLRPLGPIVAFTAAERTLTPRRRAARPSSLNMTCFGISVSPVRLLWNGPARRARSGWRRSGRPARLLDDREHVLFAQDQVLLVVDLHLGAGVLAEEDLVAGLDVERNLLAVLSDLAVAHRDDLALLGLLLGGVGDDDAALFHLLLLHALDENPIVQRTNLHGRLPSR